MLRTEPRDLEPLFAKAVELHVAGDLATAERIYQAILADYEHAASHANLGALLLQRGRWEPAAWHLTSAIQSGEGSGEALVNLAGLHAVNGDAAEAVALAEQSLATNPAMAATHSHLGWALSRQGKLQEAESSLRRALELGLTSAETLARLALVLLDQGREAEAKTNLDAASFLDADQPDVLIGIARLAQAQGSPNAGLLFNSAARRCWVRGRQEEARTLFRQAVAADASSTAILNDLAVALDRPEQQEEAIALFRQGLALEPWNAELLSNLSQALLSLGAVAEAEERAREAIAAAPHHVGAHTNLGAVLVRANRLAEAEAAYRAALALDSSNASVQYSLALVLLSLGRYPEGLSLYEYRPQVRWLDELGLRRWRGERPPSESKLCVVGEQGLGDVAFFARMLPTVAHFAEVALVCPPALMRLLQQSFPNMALRSALPAHSETYSHYISLASLAQVHLSDFVHGATSPAYLQAAAADVHGWAGLLKGPARRLRVGVCWAGGPAFGEDHLRSIDLARLADLLSNRQVEWVSLQHRPLSPTERELVERYAVKDYSEFIEDFADTAALLMHLDLVLSVDTAVAHVAGALGRPVWIMSRYAGDWRWADAAPRWYPHATVFRQSSPGDWGGVIEKVANALSTIVVKDGVSGGEHE